MESDSVVVANDVTKDFDGHIAVSHLDLEVPPGVCFGLLGPNGAGKTTTLRMIYGVTEPSEGSIDVFGLDIAKYRRAVRSRLGVTLQESVMIEVLSPVDNLRVFGRYHLLSEARIDKRVMELVDFMELNSHADVPVKYLSGGFKRRLAIALSLMNEPDLLILDEPTTGLDPAVRLALWDQLRELRRNGTTILLTTHYMDEAERLCDQLAIFSEGHVIGMGKPSDLIMEHLERETVEFTCTSGEESSLLGASALPEKSLRIRDRMLVYVEDAAPLVDVIRARDPDDRCSLVVRPTNLEDVFLTLTGTSLETDS